MNKAVPWSIKGVDFDARAAAKEAARRAGMSLGEWLNSVIAEQAAELGVDPEDIGDDERVAAVSSRLERLASQSGRRRNERPAAPRFGYDFSDEEGEDEEPRLRRRNRARPPFGNREIPYARPPRSRFQSGVDEERGWSEDAEALLDQTVRGAGWRPRRDQEQTSTALDTVARRLENIETQLDRRSAVAEPDRYLRRAISRLESRIEALAAREDEPDELAERTRSPRRDAYVETSPGPDHSPKTPVEAQAQTQAAQTQAAQTQAEQKQAAPTHGVPVLATTSGESAGTMRSSDLARIEAKLNRLLENRSAQPDGSWTGEPVQKANFGVPPSRRPMQDAIAEINRRQADLERDLNNTPSRSAAARAAPAATQQAQFFAAAMPARMPPAAPAETSPAQAEMRNTLASLKGQISDLAQHIELLRLEAAAREAKAAQTEFVREPPPAPDLRPEFHELRRQLSDIGGALGRLAQRDNLASLDEAIRELGEHVRNSRFDGVQENITGPVERLVADLKRSLADAAPGQKLDAIGQGIRAINSNIEAMAQAGVDSDSFERMCEQIGEMRDLLLRAAANPASLESIETQISALTRRVDLIASRGPTPAGANAVNESVQQIRAAFESVEPGPFIEEIEQRFAEFSRKIDSALARPAAANPQIELISQRLDAMHKSLANPPIEAIAKRLDNMQQTLTQQTQSQSAAQFEAIARKLEAMQGALARQVDGLPLAQFESLAQQLQSVQKSLAEQKPNQPPLQLDAIAKRLDAMEQSLTQQTQSQSAAQFEAIARKLEAMQGALARQVDGLPLAQFEALAQQLQSVQKSLAESKPNQPPLQLDAIAKRLDAMQQTLTQQTQSQSATQFEAIARKLEAMQGALARQVDGLPLAQFEALAQQLQSVQKSLAEQKPDQPPLQLDAIAKRLDAMQQTLAWQAERQTPVKVDTGLLEAMMQQIMEKVSAPATPSAGSAELDSLDKAVRELAGRVEAISQQPDLAGLIGLEERIGALAEKLDTPSAGPAHAQDINRSLADIANRMEENRLSAIDAASNAARSAVREVLSEIRQQDAGESNAGARELIEREISSLRALQDAADRRTHATLGAVHETLEKVVDRLAMLEEEITADEQAPARGGTKPEVPSTRESVTYASGPAPVFSRADHVREAPQPESEAKTEIQFAPAAPEMERPAPARKQALAPDTNSKSSLEDDFLIEPGSGIDPIRRSKVGSSLAPQAGDLVGDDADAARSAAPSREIPGAASASNFIAAARRAQQAAQARAEAAEAAEAAAKANKKGLRAIAPDNALAEARSRAKAAASALSGSLGRNPQAAPSEGSRWKRARGLLTSRKVLFSLAGLVLVLGALTIVRQNMLRTTKPRPVAAATVSPIAPPPAGAQIGPANAFVPTQTADPVSQPAPKTGEQIDRAPVSSIAPPEQSAALGKEHGAAPGPATGGNLHAAAAAGNAAAQYEYGVRLSDGHGETRDPARGVEWLTKAARQGLAPAQYRLGSMYEKGIGIARDAARARHWYEQAASAGNVKAMHNFAVLLAEGGEGKPDYVTAASWFRKASQFGVRDSQYNLAILYARGLGVEQNMTSSYVWFALAEKQGDTDAGVKRLDVAKRLTPSQLADARSRVEIFKPMKANLAANEVATPAGGWQADAGSATTAAPKAGGAPMLLNAPAPKAPSRTQPSGRRPKVSSLHQRNL